MSDPNNEPNSAPQIEMPRYQSHKIVHALKIRAIETILDDDMEPATSLGATITPNEDGYAPFHVDAAYVEKHDPQAGGYYVVYPDGYKSYSPAEAFESGYTLL